ncbi:MAG TPA: peptidoglycan-binding domain-containing protein [Byssovorax sp.]|jgi:hypothetical protein
MATEAPACRKALNDANRRWPNRSKVSDGIMGDARHQATKSDHNLGNAVDVSNDPASGCSGTIIAAYAITDARVTYVIFNKHIFNRSRAAEGWRAYHGSNAHEHHCHISIHPTSREDVSPWGWAPDAQGHEPGPPPPLPDGTPTTVTPLTAGGGGATTAAPVAPAPAAHAHAPPPATRAPANGEGYPGVELKRGSRGTLVTRVQQRLKDLSWDIGVDGDFGDQTDSVVRRAQARFGVAVDGVVGRRTWRALFP